MTAKLKDLKEPKENYKPLQNELGRRPHRSPEDIKNYTAYKYKAISTIALSMSNPLGDQFFALMFNDGDKDYRLLLNKHAVSQIAEHWQKFLNPEKPRANLIRKAGYYWVKMNGKWEIGRFYNDGNDSETCRWYFVASEWGFKDIDLDEIDERIIERK